MIGKTIRVQKKCIKISIEHNNRTTKINKLSNHGSYTDYRTDNMYDLCGSVDSYWLGLFLAFLSHFVSVLCSWTNDVNTQVIRALVF